MTSLLAIDRFRESARAHPTRNALVVDGVELSYAQLSDAAGQIAAAVAATRPESPFVGVFAARSQSAYASILGVLGAGRGYMPLHPDFPAARTVYMIERSGIDTLIVGREAEAPVSLCLPSVSRALTLIAEPDLAERLRDVPGKHRVVSVPAASEPVPMGHRAGDHAYLLFTSGSTGEPKGVPVSHENLASYLTTTLERYEFRPDDRFSQMFDLTFDLSVHDMFLAWSVGAALYCVPKVHVISPAQFIKRNSLTAWFSVPSVVSTMKRLRALPAGAFPSIRVSLFCGEALQYSQVDAWRRACPNSLTDNLYGPTETTIAITAYRCSSEASADVSPREGVVPIGQPFGGNDVLLVDSGMHPVTPGDTGELLLAGPQVTGGYWNDPAKTADKFVTLGDRIWYRTGDLASKGADGVLRFHGRTDTQIKIHGYRAELQEIDIALQRVCKTEEAIAVPKLSADGTCELIVGFVRSSGIDDESAILQGCRDILPSYMVPARIEFIEALPLNANGKLDRTALAGRV